MIRQGERREDLDARPGCDRRWRRQTAVSRAETARNAWAVPGDAAAGEARRQHVLDRRELSSPFRRAAGDCAMCARDRAEVDDCAERSLPRRKKHRTAV